MEWLSDPTIWMGLATLVVLEIILGIDNLVFIAILADKLPPHQRDKARLIGLSLALLMRLGLLATLSWIMRLTTPLFSVFEHAFSGRDLILLVGGLFLLFKATMELHERLEGRAHEAGGNKVYASFGLVVTQIVILDAVFSLDSVITAVGMVDELGVMFAAVIIAMVVMMLASKPLTSFVNRHPTVVVLCLGFLLMIGFSLVAEGLGFKIPKGYLYAAIVFSILIEGFNQWSRFNREKHAQRLPFRQRTANAVLTLLGSRPSTDAANEPSGQEAREEPGLEAVEHDMIRSVLTLADRSVASVMTVRTDIQWIDTRKGPEHAAQLLMQSPHTRLLVGDGELDNLQGVVQSRDLLAGLLSGKPLVLADHLREPLTLPEGTTALRALERIKQHAIPLAVVVDEYGSVEGIVTANDLLAAIAGDLADTRDADYGAEQADGGWIVDASMSMEDVERATGIALERNPAYVSLSGLFLHALERLPAVGDSVRSGDWRIDVLTLERRRVGKARITAVDEE
ncbi:TerC family protein [Pseudoxanthomonas sp. PXM02]|uniref:TerC family protein n=1 Tax=Pseudoxanthomonas sp. PXM02 TaxID=2769294 RepID=UPI00178527E6|nr:TerC family protein [Pseudoxanthomonas sp. PXM02]MBD9477891.1 TerC family protein [Pseudoxanthomonas sp. PXM02]